MAYSKLRRTWHKLRQLTRREWSWLLQAYIMLPIVTLWIRLRGFQSCRAWLERRAKRYPPARKSLQDSQPFARMVRVAATHHFLTINCLPQSLWLWYSLRRRGVPSELRLGVTSKSRDHLAAHAWVEVNGALLNEPADAETRYAPFEFPSQ